MASFIFPGPESYGQNVPAQPAPSSVSREAVTGGDFINLLLLSELALYEKEDDVRDCAGRLIERAEKLEDASLIIWQLLNIRF